jgi:heme exporter protein D
MVDAPFERHVDTPPERQAGRRTLWSTRSRWAVHLGLLLSGAAALVTLQLLHVRVAFHADVGLVFVGLVGVHLFQRRRTLARLATQLVRSQRLAERQSRLALSDLLLFFLSVNVLLSGILDWGWGALIQLPLPEPFDRWHLDSGIALVVYVAVHVWRRRKRFWRSTIR